MWALSKTGKGAWLIWTANWKVQIRILLGLDSYTALLLPTTIWFSVFYAENLFKNISKQIWWHILQMAIWLYKIRLRTINWPWVFFGAFEELGSKQMLQIS